MERGTCLCVTSPGARGVTPPSQEGSERITFISQQTDKSLLIIFPFLVSEYN